jgi:hypothetical protein
MPRRDLRHAIKEVTEYRVVSGPATCARRKSMLTGRL